MARSDIIKDGKTTVKISPWRGSTRTASLIFMSPSGTVATTTIERVLSEVAARGFSTVLTSALSHREREPFDDYGFTVYDQLHLLRLDFRTHPTTSLFDTRLQRRLFRSGRRSDIGEVINVDRHAFDKFWQFDEVALRDALAATPSSRFQVSRQGPIAAYHITGRSGTTGYLQRLAVHPDNQGTGLGRALLQDSLQWLERNRARDVFVNTQLSNHNALGLYERFGFTREPNRLSVLQYSFDSPLDLGGSSDK